MNNCPRSEKIIFVYNRHIVPITGGHRYEALLRQVLAEDFSVQTLELYRERPTKWAGKIISPLRAFRLYPSLHTSKAKVVFNSTSGFYFLPLAILLRLTGSEIIVTHHHFLFQEFRGIKRRVYKWMECNFLKVARRVITSGEGVVSEIGEYTGQNSIYLPIPFTNPFDKNNGHEEKITPERGRILYVGTIEPRKGLHHLLNGLSRREDRREYDIHIVGKEIDENYASSIKGTSANAKLRIAFHGNISEKELDFQRRKADMCVFPSELEGFGMVMAESRFYGLPVVCFNISVMPLSVENGIDGLMAPPFDDDILAEYVARIRTDRKLRSLLSENARKRADSLPTVAQFRTAAKKIFRS